MSDDKDDGGLSFSQSKDGAVVSFGMTGKVALALIAVVEAATVGMLSRFPTNDEITARAMLVDERFVQLIERVRGLEDEIKLQSDTRARLMVLESRLDSLERESPSAR